MCHYCAVAAIQSLSDWGHGLCRRLGRKATILIAGACFIVGIALCAAAVQIGMLIIGRIMIGLGVGFGNQVSALHCRAGFCAKEETGNTLDYQASNAEICLAVWHVVEGKQAMHLSPLDYAVGCLCGHYGCKSQSRSWQYGVLGNELPIFWWKIWKKMGTQMVECCCAGCASVSVRNGAPLLQGGPEQHVPAGHLLRHPDCGDRQFCSQGHWPLPVASVLGSCRWERLSPPALTGEEKIIYIRVAWWHRRQQTSFCKAHYCVSGGIGASRLPSARLIILCLISAADSPELLAPRVPQEASGLR